MALLSDTSSPNLLAKVMMKALKNEFESELRAHLQEASKKLEDEVVTKAMADFEVEAKAWLKEYHNGMTMELILKNFSVRI